MTNAPSNAIRSLRIQRGMSQGELAERVHVTRQAVSRWETGETLPGPDVLQLLSEVFGVSINALLGAPRRLICQCCGMDLDERSISREPDGALNERYCRWCYADGAFAYERLDELVDYLAQHARGEYTPEQARAYFEAVLPRLDYWRERAGE